LCQRAKRSKYRVFSKVSTGTDLQIAHREKLFLQIEIFCGNAAEINFIRTGATAILLSSEKLKKKFRGITLNEETDRVIFNDGYVVAFASASRGRANQTVLLFTETLGVA
jgi:hypothetical protein